jgi:hypothetical protein
MHSAGILLMDSGGVANKRRAVEIIKGSVPIVYIVSREASPLFPVVSHCFPIVSTHCFHCFKGSVPIVSPIVSPLFPHVIELAALRPQTRFNIAQTFAIGELSKGHAQILVEACKAPDITVALITRHTAPECMQRQMPHQLREDQFACVHAATSRILEDSMLSVIQRK